MYFHKKVKTRTNFGRKVVKNLFFRIKKKPSKYINLKIVKTHNIDRAVCDFIAGMTDRFAINLYNKSK